MYINFNFSNHHIPLVRGSYVLLIDVFRGIVLFFLYKASFQEIKKKEFLIVVSVSSLLVYIHYYGVLFFALSLMIIITFNIHNRLLIKRLLLIGTSVLVIYLPWIFVSVNQITNHTSVGGAISQVTLVDLVHTLEFIFFEHDLLTVVCTLLVLFGVYFAFQEHNQGKSIYLVTYSSSILFILVPFFISFLSFPINYSIYNYKYIIPSLPLFYILTAFSLRSTWNLLLDRISHLNRLTKMTKWKQWAMLGGAYLVIFLLVFPSFYTIYDQRAEDYKELVYEIQQRHQSNDILVFYPNWVYDPLYYYTSQNVPKLSLISLSTLHGVSDIAQMFNTSRRMWLVTIDYEVNQNFVNDLVKQGVHYEEQHFRQHIVLFLIVN